MKIHFLQKAIRVILFFVKYILRFQNQCFVSRIETSFSRNWSFVCNLLAKYKFESSLQNESFTSEIKAPFPKSEVFLQLVISTQIQSFVYKIVACSLEL